VERPVAGLPARERVIDHIALVVSVNDKGVDVRALLKIEEAPLLVTTSRLLTRECFIRKSPEPLQLI
jgi:hypothetical protein